MESFENYQGNIEDSDSLEDGLEKGTQSFSGPLMERFGMLFTTEQMNELKQDLDSIGVSAQHVNRANEEQAKEIARILQNYFEVEHSHEKPETLLSVQDVLSQ